MPNTEPHASSLDFAERVNAFAGVATVMSASDVTPSIRELTLSHPLAAQFAGVAGNDIMVLRESDERHTRRRRYSVRAVDVAASTLTLWISHDHRGTGADWAVNANVGDLVDVIGPRGKITLDPLADWHLFVGDLSAVGAFFRMAESVDPPGQVLFVVELPTMADLVVPKLPADVAPTAVFVERLDRTNDDPAALLSALSALDLPEGIGQAYLFGELGVCQSLRVALLDRGLTTEQISLKAFWRSGVGNADHGEPPKD
jgi:NADPH-dependent ferric siderophore reductase